MTQPYQWRADPPDANPGSEPDVPTRTPSHASVPTWTPLPMPTPAPAAVQMPAPMPMPIAMPAPVPMPMPTAAPVLMPAPVPLAQPPVQPHTTDEKLEAAAAISAAKELGPDYQDAVIESFLARLDQMNAARGRAPMMPVPMAASEVPQRRTTSVNQTAMVIVCVALAIPLTAIAGGMFGFIGLPITWIGIIVVALILGRGLGKN